MTCWCIDTERVLIDMVLWSMARTYSKNVEVWRVAVVLRMDDNVTHRSGQKELGRDDVESSHWHFVWT